MIDLSKIENYRENNRIEAKCALGGLPHSIWETYSAFANTLGGWILLGVEEHKDKSLHAVDLPEPEKLIADFWKKVKDPQVVSANILQKDQVQIHFVHGKHIVIVEVPQAPLYLGPVYVDGDPVSGTFIRNGEGDYRCSPEEQRELFRKADLRRKTLIKQQVIEFLTDHPASWLTEIKEAVDVEGQQIEEIMNELQKEDTVTEIEIYTEGGERKLKYKLKS